MVETVRFFSEYFSSAGSYFSLVFSYDPRIAIIPIILLLSAGFVLSRTKE